MFQQNYIDGGQKFLFVRFGQPDQLLGTTLFVPGFLTDHQPFEYLGQKLAAYGRQVVILSDPHAPHALAPKAIVEELGLSQIDVACHSAGCIHMTQAALECPEIFRQIVFLNPAGSIEDDWLIWPLACRFFDETVTQTFSPAARVKHDKLVLEKITNLFIKNFLRDVWGSLCQVYKIAQARMVDRLRRLKDKCKISIIHTESDKLFPFSVVRRLATKLGVKFIGEPGVHNQLFFKSSADRFANLIHQELKIVT